MRVLIVSQYYPPENAAIPEALARGLSERGHTVRVLTGYPNYPDGNLFDGYTQRWREHQQDGDVGIVRVPLYVDHSQSALRRALNYGSFGLSAATAGGLGRGADVIYVYATQMTPALGPWLWRLTGGAPYVLHVQDLWPDSISGSSLVGSPRGAGAVDTLLTPWLRSVYRRSAAVIGIAPTMVGTLVNRGVSESKAHLVYNWADETATKSVDRGGPDRSRPGTTRVLYAGNVGDMQDLETAVVAAHQARGVGVHLTVVGDGVALPRVKALSDQLQTTNVEFKGRVPADTISQFYQDADFALISLKDLPAFQGTSPSKLQSALASGVPVISTVQGDLRAMVQDFGVGVTADAESPAALGAALRAAAACGPEERGALRTQARVVYASRFSRAAGIAAIEAILSVAAR